MAELFRSLLRALTSAGRRTTPWVLALLLGTGAAATFGGAAEAATKPPAALVVEVGGPTTLDVSWKTVKGAARYRVAYDTKSAMKKPKYVKPTSTSVTLRGLTPGKRYYVKVKALRSSGSSLTRYSGKVQATTSATADPPRGLEVRDASATSVSLDWTSSGSGAHYRVQWADNADMSGAGYARFTDSDGTVDGLKAATGYWFKVRLIDADGNNLSAYSDAVRATTDAAPSTGSGPTPTSAQLRLGTFNIKCFNCMGDHPNERSWWDRRDDVVSDIESQDVDVLGVQEASQAWLPEHQGGKGQDLSQFEDLRNRLGGPWRLTNANRNNCQKAKTPTSCVYKDQGASKGTKILYNSDRVAMLDQGSKLLPSPEDDRFMAWAVFQQRSTGKKFFFVTTHLEPAKNFSLHIEEATTVAEEVAKQNTDHLPTFITGDMNSYKNTLNDAGVKDNPVWDVFVDRYGYVEPLGNAAGTTTGTVGATVEHRINTPLSSFNDFVPNPTNSYFGRRPNGTYLDYIFTSKKVRVLEWENVAHLDADHAYVGKQASDHNMQRATVVLP